MVRISFAPVLSATRSRDSCWITSISCLSAGSRQGLLSYERKPLPSLAERTLRDASELHLLEFPCGNYLLGLLEDLDDAPALARRQRTRLHQEDAVADAGSALLVVRLELVRTANDLAVQGVLDAVLDSDDDGLVHLVADNKALTGLAEAAGGGLFSHS